MTIIKSDFTLRVEVLGKTTGNQLTGVMLNVVVVATQEMSEVSVRDDLIKTPLI